MLDGNETANRSEEALLAGARAGRRESFEALVRRHESRVFAVLRRAVPPDEVEDLAQEAFLRAFREIDRFRGEAQFGTWLFKIVRNLLVDRHRRLRRRGVPAGLEEESGELGDAVLVDPGPSPEGELARRRDEARLAAALSALPEVDRLAVLLHDQEGLSAAEVAEAIGGSAGAVRIRLFRARRRLRALLGER